MAERIRERWTYQVEEAILCVAISRGGRLIFAGSRDGYLYCFELAGSLLWRSSTEGYPLCITLAEGSERVLVGCSNGKAYLLNYHGQLLHTLETTGDIWCASITPAAHYIALGTLDGVIALFDSIGTLLWQHTVGGPLRSISISPEGKSIVVGSEDHRVYLFDRPGKEQWHFTTGWSVSAGTQLASNTDAVVAGSEDHFVYLLDRYGKSRWQYNTGHAVNTVAITPDGRFVAAAGDGETIFLFDATGNLLWNYSTGANIQNLVLSRDGRFLVAITQNHLVILLDRRGKLIVERPMDQTLFAVAMTPNGRFFTTVSRNYSVSLIENLSDSEDVNDALFTQRLIIDLRRLYATNPHQGIVAWFDAFDQALLRRELDLCQALLQEVREPYYQLYASEQDEVASREASLWLYRGLLHQQWGEIDEARRLYELSRETQHRLHYLVGEGQAISALQTLQNAPDAVTPALHALLVNPPELMGSSETILAQRIKLGKANERHQIVLLAQQRGYLMPLVEAISSTHPAIQIAGATAVSSLLPGPEVETLLSMLSSAQWLVRWEGCLMLIRYARIYPQAFAKSRDRTQMTAKERLAHDVDPMVRQALARLLGMIGDVSHVPVLLPLLNDAEADVRIGTVEALGLLGTRRELSTLRQVADGKDFIGNSISTCVRLAALRIRQRCPIGEVSRVVCCQELTAQQEPVQPVRLFPTYNPVIHCVVTVAGTLEGTKITCAVKSRSQPMIWQIKYLDPPLQNGKPSSGRRSLKNWLYQLLGQENELFLAWREEEENVTVLPATDLVFTFAPSRGTWSAGMYSVEVLLNGDLHYKQSFKVVNREAWVATPIHYQKGLISHELKRYDEALVDYERALQFDRLHTDAWCNMGDALITRGLIVEASEAYSNAMQLDPDATLTHFCSDGLLHLLEHNNYAGVMTALCYANLLSIDPKLEKGSSVLTTQLLEAAELMLAGAKNEAATTLDQILQSAANSFYDCVAKFVAFAIRQNKKAGFDVLNQALNPIPNSALTSLARAVGLTLLNRYDEAIATIDQALYVTPNSSALYLAKAIAMALARRKEESLVVLDKALHIRPDSILLSIVKGVILYYSERKQEMLAVSQQVLRLHPDYPLAQFLQGAVFFALERYEEVIRTTEQVVTSQPDFMLAHFLEGYTLYKLGRTKEALAICQKYTQRLPNSALVHFLWGELLLASEQFTEALNVFEMALQSGLRIVPLYNQQGTILSKLTRYEEALEAYEKAITLDPGNTLANQGKADVLEHLGNVEKVQKANELTQ